MKPFLKNIILPLTILYFFIPDIQAQCDGLKNPTTFANYKGKIGVIAAYGATSGGFNDGKVEWRQDITGVSLSNQYTIPSSTPYGKDGVGPSQRGHVGGQFDERFAIVYAGDYDANTCGKLNMTPPDPSFTSAIRIGNSMNTEAEELYYEMIVNANNSLLIFWYALVMEYPKEQHGDLNPQIGIYVEKEKTPGSEDWILHKPCTQYKMIASDNALDEWKTTPCPPAGSADQPVIYKEWAPVAINVRDLMNQKIRIRFYNQDCLPTGHYSYMYLAGECMPMNITSYACAPEGSDTTGYLEAPEHLSEYQWYYGAYPSEYKVQGATNRRLYITEKDFTEEGSTELTYHCRFETRLDPKNPCEDYLEATISNTRPKVSYNAEVSCDRWVTFNNQSYVPSSASRLDTSKTVWELDGITYRTHSMVKHQFASAGKHTVTLTVENIEGCSNKAVFTVNAMDSLEVGFEMDKLNYCIDDVANFKVTSPSSYSYTWYSRSFTLMGNEVSPRLSLQDTLITLEARMGECVNSITKKIDIEPYPNLTVSGDTAICYGQSTTLTVSADTTVVSFDWSYSPSGVPIIHSGETYTAKPDNSTTFYINVTTKNGCKTPQNFNVSVLKPTISIDTTRICPGGEVTLTANGLDYLVTEYIWRSSPEAVLTPTGTKNNTLIVSPVITTDYYLTANSTLGCIPLEDTERVTVYPYPIPEIYIEPGFVDVEEPMVRLVDESVYGVTSFWDLGDGTTSSERALTYQYSGEALLKDSIKISLTSFNELSCPSHTYIQIPVDPLVIQFPNAFSPGRDNDNLFLPSTKSVFNEYHLYIYNRWGELVFETKNVYEGWDGKFNGKDCPNGGYVWIVNFTRPSKNRVYSMKGTVLLVR